MSKTHVNVTLDLQNVGGKLIDVRIPTLQPISELILNIGQTFHLAQVQKIATIRVKNKNLILLANETLAQTNVANGDVLELITLTESEQK